MLVSVVSWPPCCGAVAVNAPPTLPTSASWAHRPPVRSTNCFIRAAMLPSRVGEPMTMAWSSANSFTTAIGAS